MSGLMWPTINAALTAVSALLLFIGWRCIRAKRIAAHAWCMGTAFTTSTAFFISYLLYQARVGVVRYHGVGWMRPLYLTILLTHTVLAIVIIPLVLRTLYLAWQRRFDAHRGLARWSWPLWMYVSVTGVLVYWMVYHS